MHLPPRVLRSMSEERFKEKAALHSSDVPTFRVDKPACEL